MFSLGRRWGGGPVPSPLATVVAAILVLSLLAPSVGSAAAGGGLVTIASNDSDSVPKAGFAAMIDYCAGQTGVTTRVDTFEHLAFQDGITSYLQGAPDDVVSWFGGERMRFLAAQGLTTDISDVWASGVGASYTAPMKAVSTGYDGKQYVVPVVHYPWVFLYRKSLFAARGYTIPKTIGDLIALATRMRADGLVPIALGDDDGWPAMGTFDILDMRMNGYRFHMDLMAGRAKWTDPRVAAVFREWATLLAYAQPDAASRSWKAAAASLFSGQAGMYFIGTFAVSEALDPVVRADLGVFPFPVFGNQWDTEQAIDAPADGLMLSKAPANLPGAKAVVSCAATGAAQSRYVASNEGLLAAAADADTSSYTPLQTASAAIIASAGRIAQFLDRDARPDFVGPNGMQAFLLDFLKAPTQDIPALLQRIQAFRDSLPPAYKTTLTVRPSRPAGTIAKGTAVTFAAVVRPLGPTLATVRFAVYRRVGTVSRLALGRDVVTDATGRALLRYTFTTAGSWYVRVRVVPDTTFVGTAYGPAIRYTIR